MALLLDSIAVVLSLTLGGWYAWTVLKASRRMHALEPGPKNDERATQAEQLNQIVLSYEEVLADVARRLGLQGRTILAAGKLLDTPTEGSSVALRAEIAERLSELLEKNQVLQHELRTAQEELRAQHDELDQARAESRIDHLTQLPNRRAFDERMTDVHAGFVRNGRAYSIVVFDVDHFKTFNDSHGHAAGDAMLRTISKAAGEVRRTNDFLARAGGEEFAVLLPESDLRQCQAAAERYRRAIAATTLRLEGQRLTVTASFGAATAIAQETAGQLMARADEALYAAKAAGRNQTRVHDGCGGQPLPLEIGCAAGALGMPQY